MECTICEALVDAETLHYYICEFEDSPPAKFNFLKCPKCKSPFLSSQENFGEGWDEAYRLYPPQDKAINFSLPEPIQNAYKEARACLKTKAYTAAAIMCRKTLEGICLAHGIKARGLAPALKEMKEKGIIENRLFEWAEALRIAGNEAAHDVNSTISPQDAKDIVEFTDALLEYVFTFRDKFNEFMERRKKTSKGP